MRIKPNMLNGFTFKCDMQHTECGFRICSSHLIIEHRYQTFSLNMKSHLKIFVFMECIVVVVRGTVADLYQ